MKYLVLFLLACSSQAFAQDSIDIVYGQSIIEAVEESQDELRTDSRSEFFELVGAGQSEIKIELSSYDAGTVVGSDFDFSFARGFSNQGVFSAKFGFISRDLEGTDETFARGLKDFDFGYTHTFSRNFLVGSRLGFSPSSADRSGFSGRQSMTPFFGWTDTDGISNFGAKLSAHLDLFRSTENSAFDTLEVDPNNLYLAEGFYEFPLSEKIVAGASIGLGHLSRNGNDIVSYYRGRVYGNFNVIEDTDIGINLISNTVEREFDDSITETSIGIGIERTL